MKKILPLIFSILIFSSVFVFVILRNPDDSQQTLQLSPRKYLYDEKYGEIKTYGSGDISSETFVKNIRVNETGGASEPKIICNPKDNNFLAISSNDFLIKENFGRIFVSDDAGQNWKQKEVSLSGKFKKSTYSDPWIDYDSHGNLYYVAVQSDLLNNGREGICLSVSSDNGSTWKSDFNFIDYNSKENIYLDHPKIYIDKNSDRNIIYVTWVEVKGINTYIMFSKSSDRGNAFSSPMAIDRNDVEFSSVISNSRGEIFLIYLKDENSIAVKRSTDEGSSWGKAISTYEFNPSGKLSEAQYLIKQSPGKGIRINSEPAITMSKSGDLLITYSAAGINSDISDVHFTSLRNDSFEFTEPVRVHSDKTTNDQFLPAIDIDKGDNIFVLYQDSRNDTGNIYTETYVSVSTNRGLTFKDQKLSTKNFDPCLVAVGNYLGDYNSCTISGNKLVGVWTDGRNNNLDLYAGIFDIGEFMKNMSH